ncbi:efflux transporter periplasmic adaptor subunit [Marinobacterium aestuarii]|uniref:Efflux transporter periplasmic adaptor subunit n=1 Tax=Marinobacterium aestuarii TaxID=1821621 RepID=A0A1A9F1I5_9GAMM|nr:efflux RND transporter periplasmic adaptor subunit [Marinobacterium aestuarii]ANG63593.1 efflux transporter periplasmic adaptor subunit [Marinobacterium aestuarii]
MNTRQVVSLKAGARLRSQALRGLLFLAGTGLVATLAGCADSDATQAAPANYHVARSQVLQQQPGYALRRTFIGKVQARQSASIGFEQSGKVAKLLADEGETVLKGAVLAEQDTELLHIERQELQAQLQQTQADLALVQANLKRLNSLNKRGFSSEQSLDELQARQKGLQATRARVHASLAASQLRIDKSTLRAPYSAQISRRLTDEGEVVGAGSPAFTLLQSGPAEVHVGVPVDMLEQLHAQQQLDVRLGTRQLSARLLTKGFDVDPITRTVSLRLELPAGALSVNGELAYLALEQSFQQPGYWVPLSALTDGLRGLWNIYSLEPQAEAGLYELQSRDVQVLHATATDAYVTGALADGERVLSAGLQRLVPGQIVKLAAITPTATAPVAGPES